jgi:outer membrane protein assembly factor BamB
MLYSRRAIIATALALSVPSKARTGHTVAALQTPTATGSTGTGMFRGNPERTGANPGPGPSDTPEELWRFRAGYGEFISSPALVGNRLYIGNTDGNVYAVASDTGQEVWRAATGGPVISSPAVVEDVVYVGSFGALSALNATSGASLWQVPTGAAVDSSPTVARGVVYFGSSDGNLYAVDAESGEAGERGPFPTGSPVLSSPAVHAGVVYVGGFGLVYALRADDLSELGRYMVDGPVDTAPAVLGDMFYVATSRGRVYAFERIAADAQPGTASPNRAIWDTELGGQVFSSPAVATVGGRNYVFVSCGDSNLYALNADSGVEEWRVPQIPVFGPLASSPAVVPSDGVVYVGAGDGKVSAISISTHQPLDGWPFTVGSRVDSSPVVRDGRLYVGSADGLIAIGDTGDS